MQIWELIDNQEFNFNFPFRILEYLGEGDKTELKYDSETGEDVPSYLLDKYISAVNPGDDGVMEIEYTNLFEGYEEDE